LVEELDLLTTVECSYESVRCDHPMSPAAIAAAADQGRLRVAARTPSGRRLIARSDLLDFIKARRDARRTAQTTPSPEGAGA
jgi:hypothetical protein